MVQESIERRLHPQVAAYAVGSYNLLSDLTHLQGVRSVGATEATIFYSARILETLAAAAIQLAGLTPSASSFSNLETLVEFNLVPTTTLYWANGLRRLGNDVRHILRRAEPQDADLATIFAERWIDWFFCRFRFGPRLPAVTSDGEHLVMIRNADLPALVRAIDAEDFDPSAWLPRNFPGGESPFMAAATLAAAVTDRLLDRDESSAAFAVLDPARQRFPDDLRLQQLAVFAWKRRGDLDKAIENVEPLLARSKEDDETAGIVAGVYKQVYLDRGRNPEILAKSHRAYRGGWEGSKSSNAYLGINAAATALWLARPAESRRIAAEVRQLLLKRISALDRGGDAQMLDASYWDEVTLAEAELLLGEVARARRRYQQAFVRSAKSKGNVKVAQEQAHRHLAPLGLTLSGGEFFKPAPAVPATQLAIGVTGHRALADEAALRPSIMEAVVRLKPLAAADAAITLLSSLAAGADSLVAEVLIQEFGARLWVVLPLELSEYLRDFSPEEGRRFQSLLNLADSMVYPPSTIVPKRRAADSSPAPDPRDAAYERAGLFVVEHCDALLALWDGQPARGRGGTADIVAHARKIGRPLAWVATDPPFSLTLEVPSGKKTSGA